MHIYKRFLPIAVVALLIGCYSAPADMPLLSASAKTVAHEDCVNDFYHELSIAAMRLTKQHVTYDPAYYSMDYPDGDVPPGKGVCSDVIIRAYRQVGIDLQKEVHEDMVSHFSAYPKKWSMSSTDKNIDHRRVPNLMKYFERKGITLPTVRDALQYQAGDIVAWDIGRGITHIGFVVCKKSGDAKRNLVVHNIGRGQVMEDCLFSFKVIGHYRYQ